MFIGGIYRIKRNWKDNDQKRKLYYLLITWRKSENYTFKLYLFSTAAGRIKALLRRIQNIHTGTQGQALKAGHRNFFTPE